MWLQSCDGYHEEITSQYEQMRWELIAMHSVEDPQHKSRRWRVHNVGKVSPSSSSDDENEGAGADPEPDYGAYVVC